METVRPNRAPPGGNHMVTNDISFTGRLNSLGKERDRWCLVIPRNTAQMLPKNAIYQVTLRPIGSLR